VFTGLFHAPIALLKFTLQGENIVLVTGDLTKTGIAEVPGVTNEELPYFQLLCLVNPSGCGSVAVPIKVPCLISSIDDFTTASAAYLSFRL
jgi:hypothetical protein